MHILAYCYHWDRNTIVNLTRSERKMWVEMVRTQKEAEENAINKDSTSNTPTHSYQESQEDFK